MRSKFSASTRCFAAICAVGARCCSAQPPQYAEMRAARLDAVGRARQQRLDACFVEVAMARGHADDRTLARQRAGHEHGLAVDTGDAAAVVRKIGDFDFVCLHSVVSRCGSQESSRGRVTGDTPCRIVAGAH